MSKKRVAQFQNEDAGNMQQGEGHPMKPLRIKMTHQLIINQDIWKLLDIYEPHRATAEEQYSFHNEDQIDFLQNISPKLDLKTLYYNFQKNNNQSNSVLKEDQKKQGIGEKDCPVFDGMWLFNSICSGASIDSAKLINNNSADICINWMGGLHHAKKSHASGFCFTNDIVMCIIELLKHHPRVLYVDIDVHHGDGVEEAFQCTNRVMTVSFHLQGNFFPGTGSINDIGKHDGKNYCVNVPLLPGIDDFMFNSLFKSVIEKVIMTYQPHVIILQCGADSLADDIIGKFNLTIAGHSECVTYLKSFNLPLILLGGGGQTMRNVARCWCLETAKCLNVDLDNNLPENDYMYFYGNNKILQYEPVKNIANLNKSKDIEITKNIIFDNLKKIEYAPSIGLFEAPEDFLSLNKKKNNRQQVY